MNLIEDLIGKEDVDATDIFRIVRKLVEKGADGARVRKLMNANIKSMSAKVQSMPSSSYWDYREAFLFVATKVLPRVYSYLFPDRFKNQGLANNTPKSTSSAVCNVVFYVATGVPDPGVCAALDGWDPVIDQTWN
jgi:hypothetical protein